MIGIWIGKLALLALRLLGRRATSLPGKLALRVSPRVLARLGGQLQRCVIVTGTNGKTTTAALLAAALRTTGPLIHNEEGSNMSQGLATALLRSTNWFGRLQVKQAVLEIDEATLPRVAVWFPAQILVVTNVFRDQLDRYGELDTAIQKLLEGIRQTSATLILNADDPLCAHIGRASGKPTQYYGLSADDVSLSARAQMRDGAFCLACGQRLNYDSFFYGQLGRYACPQCDFARPEAAVEGAYLGAALRVHAQGELPHVYALPVRGIFNAYNALAAIAASRVWGVLPDEIQTGLSTFRAPLGRMQSFATDPPSVLNLIKNPTGCDSVLQTISREPQTRVLCIAINDLAADGRDVSWLWDVDFELLAEEGHTWHIVTTGLRAEDMALRLKYAGVPEAAITSIPDLTEATHHTFAVASLHGDAPVYCLATYTALYAMAEILERKESLQHDGVAAHRASVS